MATSPATAAGAAGLAPEARVAVPAGSPASGAAAAGKALVEAPRHLRIHSGGLGIARPEDPDGGALTVTIRALPYGLVRNGAAALKTGDRLRPEELAALVFVPEPGFTGPAGRLEYLVEDDHGGRTGSVVEIDVLSAAPAAAQLPGAARRERPRGEDAEAFPPPRQDPHHAEAARRARPAEPPERHAGMPVTAALPQTPPPPETEPRPGAAAEERLASLLRPVAPPTTGSVEERHFQDCPTCPWMVRIPGGGFTMGQGAQDPAALPWRHVALRPFALGRYPVTVAEWKACGAGGGCGPLPRLAVAEDATPVHNVSWEDAQAYIAWLSRATGRRYRLPSEAEWEYAARAGTTTRYWWGDQVGAALADCVECGGTRDSRGPLPVDSFPPNAFGLHGMLGGVSQWVQDCWARNYQGAPADGTAREARGGCMQRVLRGGSFRSGRNDILPVARNRYDAPVRYIANGFRVARDLD